MSTIYKWFDTVDVITSTTTGVLLRAADPVLVKSGATTNAAQATVGTMSSLWTVSTSSSTGTNLLPYGVIQLTSPTSAQWFLSTATQVGQCVQIFYNSTSTSSASNVTSASTGAMTFASTETSSGMTFTFNQVGRAYLELTASPTSSSSSPACQWLVTGRSAAGLLCT